MAKWLTKLTRPKIWGEYPFLLSVCVGDAEEELICVVSGYGPDGVLADSVSTVGVVATNTVIDFNIRDIWSNGVGSLPDPNISYLTVYIKDSFDEVKTDVITIDSVEACKNPIMLMGRNSLGGVMQWLFDYSQDYEPSFDDDVKAKRLIMYDNTLTQNQFYALQDFITLGSVYRNPIVEFTSTTNKTTTRNGQQVYVVGTDNSKIGVVVIVTKNKTQTKAINNSFEIEIEYPIEFAP